uniref:Uncharacterized protein n=1 Tax=viral metagenome TaxID=1070528 RepID=A0A6C0D7A9_9ZZZZ
MEKLNKLKNLISKEQNKYQKYLDDTPSNTSTQRINIFTQNIINIRLFVVSKLESLRIKIKNDAKSLTILDNEIRQLYEKIYEDMKIMNDTNAISNESQIDYKKEITYVNQLKTVLEQREKEISSTKEIPKKAKTEIMNKIKKVTITLDDASKELEKFQKKESSEESNEKIKKETSKETQHEFQKVREEILKINTDVNKKIADVNNEITDVNKTIPGQEIELVDMKKETSTALILRDPNIPPPPPSNYNIKKFNPLRGMLGGKKTIKKRKHFSRTRKHKS